MFLQFFANGGGPARVGIECGHSGWRWRDDVAEDALIDPCAASDGRRGGAVCSDFQNSGLREEGTARTVVRQCDFADGAACHARDAVVNGKALIEHREVRFYEMRDA